MSRVSVVIPNWNGRHWLPGCLGALREQSFRDFDVRLVDNGSDDDSVPYVEEKFPEVRIIRFERNVGFAAAVNAGIRQSAGEYVALLNNDTRPEPKWLGELAGAMDEAPGDVASLASKMLDMDDPAIMENGGDLLTWHGEACKRGHGRPAERFLKVEEVLSPCAGAALYRRSLFEEIGLFDERFFAYLEDVDFGLRARLAGYRCLFVPTARVLHQGHGSDIPRSRYVRLITRNRLMLFLKNMPGSLILRHAPRILHGQLYFLLLYRRPLSSAAGYLSLLPVLPHVVTERAKLRKKATLLPDQAEVLLARERAGETLREIFLRRIGRPAR